MRAIRGASSRTNDLVSRSAAAISLATRLTIESFSLARPVIGRGALIKNKRAAGRAQDIADVNALDSEQRR